MSRLWRPATGTGSALFLAVLLAVLPFCPAPARATVGFACNSEDDAVKFVVNGAYGTSLGSGLAAFGADIKVLLPSAPKELRDLHLDRSHVRQDWFVGRDIKILMRWEPIDDAPYREVILIIEARRGKAEESAYLGRYSLRLQWMPPGPGVETKKLEASGKVACGTG
jgi:hypothetical protein